MGQSRFQNSCEFFVEGLAMILREAVISDLDSIEKIYQEHFAHEKKYGAYTIFQEGVYPTRKIAETALQNGALHIYEEHGIILGSIISDGQQPDEYKKIDWPSKASDDKVKVIHLIIVKPSVYGKGVGSALVNYIIDNAKKQSYMAIRLDTGEQNIPAASLYKKLGFQLAANSSMKVGGMIPHSHHLFFEKII